MSNLINLILLKDDVFIWSAEDWLTLRKEHRIIGELIGCLSKLPRQETFLGLPSLLSAEEATLLVEKQIARIIRCPCLQKPPTESIIERFESYREKLYQEQKDYLREQRKSQIISVMDKIVEGKRRKILGLQTAKKKLRKPLDPKLQEALQNVDINTNDLLEEELAKLPKLDKQEALVQTHTAYPWLQEEDIEVVDWKYPFTPSQHLKYKTYKDLWEQGYYISSGDKFGGDFLVYPGDPVLFHAQFIVQCQDRKEEMTVTDLVGQCRVACHVRKTQVFATLSEDGNSIKYQSFQWADSNALENG